MRWCLKIKISFFIIIFFRSPPLLTTHISLLSKIFVLVNASDMIRLYKTNIHESPSDQCYSLFNQCRSLFSHHQLSSDCVTAKPHLSINPYVILMPIGVFKLSVKRFYIFEFGVLPESVYNPYPCVLFVIYTCNYGAIMIYNSTIIAWMVMKYVSILSFSNMEIFVHSMTSSLCTLPLYWLDKCCYLFPVKSLYKNRFL